MHSVYCYKFFSMDIKFAEGPDAQYNEAVNIEISSSSLSVGDILFTRCWRGKLLVGKHLLFTSAYQFVRIKIAKRNL